MSAPADDPPVSPAAHGLLPVARRSRAVAGPLAGLRLAVKDVFDLAGERTGAGNPDWARTHPPARCDAWAVARLLKAGADLIGRTVSDELAFSLNGENCHFGTPRNPRAPGRRPGGSSSGSASSVAAGLADIGLGTDTSGSIRVPGAYCGLFGLRPTHGAVPVAGVVPLAPEFDTVGWLTRDAATLAGVGEILLPAVPTVMPVRALLLEDAFAAADPRLRALAAPVVARLEQRFGAVETRHLPDGSLDRWAETYRVVQGAAVWATHGDWYTATRPAMAPDIAERMAACAAITGTQAAVAQAEAADIRTLVRTLVGVDRLLCLPTAPSIAPPVGTVDPAGRRRLIALTCIAGFGGLPQVTLPVGEIDGCPVGLSLIGPADSDRTLIALAGGLL